MRKLLFLLAIAAQAIVAQAQNSNNKEPYMTRSLSGDAIKEVEARTSGGSISVTGVTPSEARIEVYVSGNNNQNLSKEEIQQRLDELYNLDVTVANNKLTAMAKSKEQIRDWKKALNIAYKIYVPQTVATDLSTSGGSIHLASLNGPQSFTTSGGSLHLKQVSGKINGRTSGGSIHLEDTNNEIDLTTSGGSIHAKNCSGNIRLATSGGSLDLSDLKGTIKATTSGGSVKGRNVEGELITFTSGGSINLTDLASSLETSTAGGNISVSFKSLGKYVKVHNSAGNIDITLPKDKGLDLDLSGTISNTSLTNFSGRMDDNEVRGKLNGGGVPVTVNAGAGRIRLQLQ
ncbi:MAG TPA: DUF4097 family beta strand repeat-containing protein [Flavisolibacter sp.]|jgi:hypothetical protein|nr:DUF4097 family beta strand repeat-containing protein [Flavisolibacter sp.]